MKVFISWSGDRSHAIATLLKNWLRLVIQALDPWLSSQNIEGGTVWFNEITAQLKDISTGIICLTKENKDKPWILFEAGALAKGLTTSRVCTLLIDLDPKDIEPPLGQFNHTKIDREGLRKLLNDLNARLGDLALDEAILSQAFDAHWPKFESDLKDALEKYKPSTHPKSRTADEVLSEILENTRVLLTTSRKSAADAITQQFLAAHTSNQDEESIGWKKMESRIPDSERWKFGYDGKSLAAMRKARARAEQLKMPPVGPNESQPPSP